MNKIHTFYILLSMLFFLPVSQVQATEIISHTNGQTLESTSVTFEWQGDWDAESYYFMVGTRMGVYDICLKTGDASTTSQLVQVLPDNGMDLYIQINTYAGGTYRYDYFTYKTPKRVDLPTGADMITPVADSTLTSTTATFEWQDIGAYQYWLDIGTTPGGKDLLSKQVGYSIQPDFPASATVLELPASGIPLYVRLWSQIGDDWVFTDSIYTAYTDPEYWAPAEMISPVPGSDFDSTTVTFDWEDIADATSYRIRLGRWAGDSTYGNLSGLLTPGATFESLPETGGKVYVRLTTYKGSQNRYVDYEYNFKDPDPAP